MGEMLDSVFSNSVNLGTGLILLLAGTKMRAGTFTVGDFALFVYYLTFVTQFITNVGKFITYFKQMSVSLERIDDALAGGIGEGADDGEFASFAKKAAALAEAEGRQNEAEHDMRDNAELAAAIEVSWTDYTASPIQAEASRTFTSA